MNSFIASTAAETPYPLHRNHYDYFIPPFSTTEDEKKVNPLMTPVPTSYLPLANPTFSVEWLGESDRIAKAMGVPRNTTENWNTYCQRVLNSDLKVYNELKTECESVLSTELEFKNGIEAFITTLIESGDFNNAETIKTIRGLHEVLVPHIQRLHTLKLLLDGLGVDTAEIFIELGSSIEVIDEKIKDQGIATDVTSSTDLFFLYVVKSCVGKLTSDDKTEIKKLMRLLKVDDKTINLFLRSSNSAENFVAIQSIEEFVQITITKDNIMAANGNFLNLKTVAGLEKLIQMYVTIESYGSEDQKDFIRNHLKLKELITGTIDANLEIQNLFAKTDSPSFSSIEMNNIQTQVKNIFFISAKDCDDFFNSSTFTSLGSYNDNEKGFLGSFFKQYQRKQLATCKYILARDYDPAKFTSNQEEVLQTYYSTPSVERLISLVQQQPINPVSFPNWPTYLENVYSRGWLLTQSFGEMKWTACNLSLPEEIKDYTLIESTLNEFNVNMRIATNMMSSFNEIVLNVKEDARFPILASSILSSIEVYIIKLKEFKEHHPEIPEEFKSKLTAIEDFAKTLTGFKYEHIEPNVLGMEIIINIIKSEGTIIPPNDYDKYTTIQQMDSFIKNRYGSKNISFSLYHEISNIISVTKIHQAIWENKVSTPLTHANAENLNVQGLFKLTTTDLKKNIGEGTFVKLREGRTDIALSDTFFSRNNKLPTNKEVYDKLLAGSDITPQETEGVSQAYVGFLTTSGSGLIPRKNFPMVIEAQITFDEEFEKTSLQIFKTRLNNLEWPTRVSQFFKLFTLSWNATNVNFVELNQTQHLTVESYEKEVLSHYDEEFTHVDSVNKLIKLMSKIFQTTTNGMLPIMNKITVRLHSKYLELSPNEYNARYKTFYEMVTSKFSDYPNSSDNEVIFKIISFHLAIQDTELLDTLETYITKTNDSPLQIVNELFTISRRPLVNVPELYEPIATLENYNLQIKKGINPRHFLESFYHLTQLFEFGLTRQYEPRFGTIENALKTILELFLNHNLNKDRLTIYTEIFRNPYVNNNPSIKEFCVTVITRYLFPERFPGKLNYDTQFHEDVATTQLDGNSSTHSLMSWVTELNSKKFAETAVDVWSEQELHDTVPVYALPFNTKVYEDFFKTSYNPDGVKNEGFSDEPPEPPPPQQEYPLTVFNNSEVTSHVLNEKNDTKDTKEIPPEFHKVNQQPPEVKIERELAVSFGRRTYKDFCQVVFSSNGGLSNIPQLKTVEYLWSIQPNLEFVIAVMPHIAYLPSFESLYNDIQNSTINLVKVSLKKWMETMAIDKVDKRTQMINLLLERALIVGELGDVIIDLGLGCLFSMNQYEKGEGRLIVDLPSFSVLMNEMYRHKNYDVNMLFLYIKHSFLMYTTYPNLVWNSDLFFNSVLSFDNINKFFSTTPLELEYSDSSAPSVIIMNPTNVSIADQTMRSTVGRAQTDAEMRLGRLNYDLNTKCLTPLKVFTLDFLLSKNSSDFDMVAREHESILRDCKVINTEKQHVVLYMPAAPSILFDIYPTLRLSSAKIDFVVDGTQLLRAEIETLRPISSIKIKGVINSTIEKLQVLTSEPSYVLINSNLITFQTTFSSLLDEYDSFQAEFKDGMRPYSFMNTEGTLDEKNKKTLNNQHNNLNLTMVKFRIVNQKMTEELSRFTSELKIGNITLSYSEMEQNVLSFMGELRLKGNLNNYELSVANTKEIETSLLKIGDNYQSVDCSVEIQEIQSRLNDPNYVLDKTMRLKIQSEIDLMRPFQTQIKNSNALLTLQSKINILVSAFNYDATVNEKGNHYSLKELRTTEARIYTLFGDFDGDKASIAKYETDSRRTIQDTISSYESSIASLEIKLDNQKSTAIETLGKLNNIIKMDADAEFKAAVSLPFLMTTKTEFDGNIKLINEQSTDLSNLLEQKQELTGEEIVQGTGISFDETLFRGRSELLGTVITERETALVKANQENTEFAYIEAEAFLTGVLTHMTNFPLTTDTEEINYDVIYQQFNRSSVEFEGAATLELDLYNEMTYIKKNSSEITTRHELKREALTSSLESVKGAVLKFNENLINFKTSSSLYKKAKDAVNKFKSENNNDLKNINALLLELRTIEDSLLKVPGIVELKPEFTDYYTFIREKNLVLEKSKEELLNNIKQSQSLIRVLISKENLEALGEETNNYITMLNELSTINGGYNNFDSTHTISGMQESARNELRLAEERFESRAIAEKQILETQQEIVGFLTSVQNSITTKNVTESALNQFSSKMDTYTPFLDDQAGREWRSSEVFSPLYDSVFEAMSLLSKERSETVNLFRELNDYKEANIDPLLIKGSIMDAEAASDFDLTGRALLSFCKTNSTNSKLKLTEETLKKETNELESAATALDKLSSMIVVKIRTDKAVREISLTLRNFKLLENPTLVDINSAIDEVLKFYPDDADADDDDAFKQFDKELDDLGDQHSNIISKIETVKKNITFAKETLTQKQLEFDSAQQKSDLESMRRIFGEMDAAKGTYVAELSAFVELTGTTTYDDNQDIDSMKHVLNQQVTDNEAAVKTLSDKVHDAEVIKTRIANEAGTASAETAVLDYFRNVDSLIDSGDITDEDIRLFQRKETLTPLLSNVESTQTTEIQFITGSKLTTEENREALFLVDDTSSFETMFTETQENVIEKMKLLVEKDTERTTKIQELQTFVTQNVEPFLNDKPISNLAKAIEISENAKRLLTLIPPPIIRRSESFFDASIYSQMFVSMDANILQQGDENQKTKLEGERLTAIQKSFSEATELKSNNKPIEKLDLKESISLLPPISAIIQSLDSRNASNVPNSPYVELKTFETDLRRHISFLNGTKAELKVEATRMSFEIGTLQSSFNRIKSDVTKTQIRDAIRNYIDTLIKIDQVSGENTHGETIQHLKTQVRKNNADYLQFVQGERRKATEKITASDEELNGYFETVGNLVDTKTITRTQLNEYDSISQTLYGKLDKSIEAEISTIQQNKIQGEDESLLTTPSSLLLQQRTSEKKAIDLKIADLKGRDSIRTNKIKALKQTSGEMLKLVPTVEDSNIKVFYDFYTNFKRDRIDVGDPEVIDSDSDVLTNYMKSILPTFLRTCENAISTSKNSITEGLTGTETDNKFSDSGLNKLVETAKMFFPKFTILEQITTEEEKLEKPYLTIQQIKLELSDEIKKKTKSLEEKVPEADSEFAEFSAKFETFIQKYEKLDEASFQLENLKLISTELTSLIGLTVSSFQEINKLNGTDTNNDKIVALETGNTKIQAIVLREERRAFSELKFRIDTAHNLTTSRQGEFTAYVSYWRNGIRDKNITTNDNPLLVSEQYDAKKQLVLEAFDAEIEIDSEDADSLRVRRDNKEEFITQSVEQKRILEEDVSQFVTKESDRVEKNLLYKEYIVTDVNPLIQHQLFGVESATLVYDTGLAMFQRLNRSEIIGMEDNTTAVELEQLKLVIDSRDASIKSVKKDTEAAKRVLLTAIAKIPKIGIFTGVFFSIKQPEVTQTKWEIEESQRLLELYDTEIKKLESLYDNKGSNIKSIIAFKDVYNKESLAITDHKTINDKHQEDINTFMADKKKEFDSLSRSVSTQSEKLITDSNEKFDIATETDKVSTFKRALNKLEKLAGENNLGQANMNSLVGPMYEKYEQANKAIILRTQSLKSVQTQTDTKYQLTKNKIDELVPPAQWIWSPFSSTPDSPYNDDYFSGIDAKLEMAEKSLESLRATAAIEMDMLPDKQRSLEITGLLQEQESNLATDKMTIQKAKDKFASDKIAKQEKNSALILQVISEVTQSIDSFGKEYNYASKISEIGIDQSSTLIKTLFDKLSGLKDESNNVTQELNKKLNAISRIIVNIQFKRNELKTALLNSNNKISKAQTEISDSDSDEVYKSKSETLIQLCNKGIEIKEALNKLEPNTQSILFEQGLKNTLESQVATRVEKKEALRVWRQSEILTGLDNTLQVQIQVLLRPVDDNSSQYEEVSSNLQILKQKINELYIPKNQAEEQNKLTLQSEVEEAIRTCNAEKVKFDDVQTKWSNISGLLISNPDDMGYDEVRAFQLVLTSAYDIFTSANNATANKYTKETDVSRVNAEYLSLIRTTLVRGETLKLAYETFDDLGRNVTTIMDKLSKEHVVNHAISLEDSAYLFRVTIELNTLEDILDKFEISKAGLVHVIGEGDQKEKEKFRIGETHQTARQFVTSTRVVIESQRDRFEVLNANKIKEDARNQRIETIKAEFNELYDVSLVTAMDPSKINLKEGQVTLDKLFSGITSLSAEYAKTSDLLVKYQNYNSLLKGHRTALDTAKVKVNESNAKVTEKIAEIDIDINSENEETYLLSIDENLKQLESLINATVIDIAQLNEVMNENDGPNENNIQTYLISTFGKLQEISTRVFDIRETKEAEKRESVRKSQVNSWFETSQVTIRDLKGNAPVPGNLFACNSLKSSIKQVYNASNELHLTDEENATRSLRMTEDLGPLDVKIGELNAEKSRLENKQQSLSVSLDERLTENPFQSSSSLNIAQTESILNDYFDTLNKLQEISGEKLVDSGKKDFKTMLVDFKTKQVETMSTEVRDNKETVEAHIRELTNSSITKLDEVEAYKQKLTNSKESLENLRTSVDSFYSMSTMYFPDDTSTRDELNAETERFIRENTEKLNRLDTKTQAKIATLTDAKTLRDETMNTAATSTAAVILNATSDFDKVLILMETPNLNVDDFNARKEGANHLYGLALEAINAQELIIEGNTHEDLGDRIQRLALLSAQRDSLLTRKTAFDDSTSTNKNVLKNVEKSAIRKISLEIASQLNKLSPENINIETDEAIVNNLKPLIQKFSTRVDDYSGKMLENKEKNEFLGLGYFGKLESFEARLRERKSTLEANQANTTAARNAYDQVKSLKIQEQQAKANASNKSSIPMLKTIEDGRQLVKTLREELDKVKSALGVETGFLHSGDSKYVKRTTENQGSITVEENWINNLEMEINGLVVEEEIRGIKKTIEVIRVQVNSNEIKNVLTLTSTLDQVGEEYDKLIAKARTDDEKKVFLENKAADQEKINNKITALNTSIFQLTSQAKIHKQKLDAFDNFVRNPKNTDWDILLNYANEVLIDANEYIRIHEEIDFKIGSVLVIDNTLVLTKIQKLIVSFGEAKAEKEIADNAAVLEKIRIQTESNTILQTANITTMDAKKVASDFITSLGTSVTIGEDTLTEATRLIGLATQAAAHEIGLLDTNGINVYTPEELLEQKSQLERSKSVFETEQTFRVDKIKSDAEALKWTQYLEQKLQFKLAQSNSEQIKTGITQSFQQTKYWYDHLVPENIGESMFVSFGRQVTGIRTKLNSEYKVSCEVEYRMLNENPALSDSVTYETYKAEVDAFVKDIEAALVKIETDLASKKTTFDSNKAKQSEAEKLRIDAAFGQLMKTNLGTLILEMEKKINSTTVSDGSYINIESDIRLASDYIQGIRDFSNKYQVGTERQESYVFIDAMEAKLYNMIQLLAARKSTEHSERLGKMFERETDIAALEAKLLSQRLLDDEKHAKMKAAILKNLHDGNAEDAIRLSELLTASFETSKNNAKKGAERLSYLNEQARLDAERQSKILAEQLALAKLDAELRAAKLRDISKRNGFSEDSFMSYITAFCLYVIYYLNEYVRLNKTVVKNVFDILAYFNQFALTSLTEPTEPTVIFSNAKELVNQLLSINGGIKNSLPVFLITFFDYHIVRLILSFVYFMFSIESKSNIKLPIVPTMKPLPMGSVAKKGAEGISTTTSYKDSGDSGHKKGYSDSTKTPKLEGESRSDSDEDGEDGEDGEDDEDGEDGEDGEDDEDEDEDEDKTPEDDSISVSGKNGDDSKWTNRRVSDNVCEKYDHLFEENYEMFDKMRGGMKNSGVGRGSMGPQYDVPPVIPGFPPRQFLRREPTTPREILGLDPLKTINLREPIKIGDRFFYPPKNPISNPKPDYKRWGTQSGYYEYKNDEGNLVQYLEDPGEEVVVVEPSIGFLRGLVDGFSAAPGRIFDMYNDYFPVVPESEEEREARMLKEKYNAEVIANRTKYDKYVTDRSRLSSDELLIGIQTERRIKENRIRMALLARAKTLDASEEEKKIISDYEAKLAAETEEEKEARLAREEKAVNDQVEKINFEAAVGIGERRAILNQRPIQKHVNTISAYKKTMEDEKERLAREARAVEKAGKDLYEAAKTKSRNFLNGLTPAEKQIYLEYNARKNETPEQRKEREDKEDKEDLKTINAENQRIFHNKMLENVNYWSGVFGLVGKVFNDGGYAFQIGSHSLNRQSQVGVAGSVSEKEFESEEQPPKYFKEITSKFLPSMTTIQIESNLSGLDGLIKDVISDGRCFSGAALFSHKLNKQREGNPISHAAGITWNVDFSPAEKKSDSQELNKLIGETIIEPIKSKHNNETETDLVEFVYEYHFGYEDAEILDEVFESKPRNIIKNALFQLDLNEKIGDLLEKLNKLDNSFKEYDKSYWLTRLFKKRPEMRDYLALSGSGNYLPEEIKFNRYTNPDLWDFLGIEGDEDDTSMITFEMLNAKLVEISNNIKKKPEFEKYYVPYIGYIESLNQVSKPDVDAGEPTAKLDAYPWTQPTVGPAQVFADVNNTNVVIKYEESYNQKNVVYNPRDPVTNKFTEADSTVYLLFRNMNGWNHYVSLIDPQFHQEIKADSPPLPSDYTILELMLDGHLYKNTYTYYYLNARNTSNQDKRILRYEKTDPIIDDNRLFTLYSMSEEEINESKLREKVPVGFRTIEGPRLIMIDDKVSIYDYEASNYVTTNGVVNVFPLKKVPEIASKMEEEEEEDLTPSEYTILEVNVGGNIVENGHKGTIDETHGAFVETDQWEEYPFVFEPGEQITRDFLEVNLDGTIMRKNGIVIKRGMIGKINEAGEFGQIPPQVAKWSSRFLFTPTVHRFVEVYPDNTYLKEGMTVSNGQLQENTYEYVPDGPNKYKKRLKATAPKKPLVDNKLYLKLYKMSESDIEETKRNEKIAPKFKTIEGPRKAVIDEKDAIYDYETSQYVTTALTEPELNMDIYNDLFNKYTRKPVKYKMYEPIELDGRKSIPFIKEKTLKYSYITNTPPKPMSGGGVKKSNHDYEALFEMEPEPVITDYTDLFETEPEPVMTDYTDLFETEPEPEPVMTDYTDLFETEPEPVMTDYTNLFETEPEPVVVVTSVEDITDLCELDQNPVRTVEII